MDADVNTPAHATQMCETDSRNPIWLALVLPQINGQGVEIKIHPVVVIRSDGKERSELCHHAFSIRGDDAKHSGPLFIGRPPISFLEIPANTAVAPSDLRKPLRSKPFFMMICPFLRMIGQFTFFAEPTSA